MRRTLITLVMSAAVLVAAPSAALAAHHSHHHARHHRARRASHIRHRQFGRADTTQPGNSEQAGTVASFANGILTITLNDGSTVSGAVTNDTQLSCMAPDSTSQGDDESGSGDDSSNSGDDNGDSSSTSGDDNGDNSSASDDDNGGDDNAQMCSTADLTPGTPVAEANLEVSGSGATWNSVDLITSSSSSSSSDD